MRFRVEHHTHYAYDVPVALGPTVLRLLPQLPAEQLLSHTLHVSPTPLQETTSVDAHGNTVITVTFAGATQDFTCTSRFEADTRPKASALDLGWQPLPWTRNAQRELGQYASGLDETPFDAAVFAFAETHAAASGRHVLSFLSRLNQHLYAAVDRHIRPTGDAQSPRETLASMRGACRDITTLFMAACRSQGLAARFVSGYQFAADTPDGQRHLHAWPEVFLPGFGWQGYDPTHGTAVGHGHVALCRGPTQAATMPVEGGFTFTGPNVTSTLRYSVEVETFD